MISAGYIIAKEGPKAICFCRGLAKNLSDGKGVGASVVAAGHSSGTIEKTESAIGIVNSFTLWLSSSFAF